MKRLSGKFGRPRPAAPAGRYVAGAALPGGLARQSSWKELATCGGHRLQRWRK